MCIRDRSRGFGFVSFQREDSAKQVLQNRYHDMLGKRVEVKSAVPRGQAPPPQRGPPRSSQGYGYARGGGPGSGYGYGGNGPSLEEDPLHGVRKAASKVKSNLVMGILTSQKHLLMVGLNILLLKVMFITITQKLVYRSGNDHPKCNNCRSLDVIVSILRILRNLPR